MNVSHKVFIRSEGEDSPHSNRSLQGPCPCALGLRECPLVTGACASLPQLYRNLWAAVLQGSGALERASWWPEFARKPVVGSLKSQL